MAITLNLLPQDQVISGTLGKFLRIGKSLGLIVLIIYLLFSIGYTFLLITNNTKIKELTLANNSAEMKVLELESSESKAFLLKDRIKKIETLKLIPSSLNNLAGAIGLLDTLPPTARVTELNLDSKKVELTVNLKSTGDLSRFLESAKNSGKFGSVIITSFGLSPTTGYLVSFNLLVPTKNEKL